jgi:hypothetical protein
MEEVQGDDPVMFDQSGNLVLPPGALEEFRIVKEREICPLSYGCICHMPKVRKDMGEKDDSRRKAEMQRLPHLHEGR